MTHDFQLADFPGTTFQLQTSIWTGRSRLYKDGALLEQTKEKGKPFLIPSATDADVVRAFPKPSYPDLVPVLEINGVTHRVVEKLPWYEYVLGGLPLLLLFIGGGIGAGIGALSTYTNYGILRKQTLSKPARYAAVIGVGLAGVLVYVLLAGLLVVLLKK